MNNSISIIGYFLQAGLIVKSVMLMLLVVSILSWTLILQRQWYFRQTQQACQAFIRRFWESSSLKQLYLDIDNNLDKKQGIVSIFHAGFKEFVSQRQLHKDPIEPMQRAMQIKQAKETFRLEEYLPFLASVGSISPYVGLFGTVWGIMTSLQAIGQTQQATISMVAPGIAEALVATALGLFTAIPAVIAFNRYTHKANHLLDQYTLFQEEFLALVEKQMNSLNHNAESIC